jgi:hypothetical protein
MIHNIVPRQGDQIGRIFANWAIVFIWAVFVITELAQIFWLLFTTKVVNVILFTNNELGYILGGFFANSSGHSGPRARFIK